MTENTNNETEKHNWLPKNIFAKIAFFILLADGLQGFIGSRNLLFLVEIAVAFMLSPKVYKRIIK
jgi:hypothetical protein